MKFKVGQKVVVKDNLDKIMDFKGGYVRDMDKMIGRIVTIEDINKDRNTIYIKEDSYCWDERAFEPLEFDGIDDLKLGDIITLRNGDKLIYNDDDNFADLEEKPENPICDTGDFNDNLEYEDCCHKEDSKYDIVKIERPTVYDTLYERAEAKEMTLKEVCKELGYEVKIVKEKK